MKCRAASGIPVISAKFVAMKRYWVANSTAAKKASRDRGSQRDGLPPFMVIKRWCPAFYKRIFLLTIFTHSYAPDISHS